MTKHPYYNKPNEHKEINPGVFVVIGAIFIAAMFAAFWFIILIHYLFGWEGIVLFGMALITCVSVWMAWNMFFNHR
jgi:uncharacterized membrane protein